MKVKIINSQEYKFIIVPQFERYYSEDTHYGVYTFLTEDDIPKYTDYKDQLFLDDKEKTTSRRMSLLCGNMQRLYVGSEYEVTATVEYNTKYKSWQYIPKIVTAVIPQTADQQKKFLESLLTQKQAEVLLKEYPNVVEDVINNRDNVEIDKLYGIGKTTWESIRERIINNYIISDILILLQPLGVSFNMIKKLISEEPNPALLKEKLLDNPYIMTKIKGFGFKKVDTLALKLNPEIRLSSKRVYAFINYYLKDMGDSIGHTWVYEDNLESAVRDNISECLDIYYDVIKSEKNNNSLLYFEDNKVGLKLYHTMEKNIFNILKSLNEYHQHWNLNENGIKEAESEQGFTFTEEQNQVVKHALNDNVVIISGRAGCVDCNTEFFDGTQWKKISEYQVGDFVLQYNKDNTTNLVKPIAYIKQPCKYLNHLINISGSLDQCLDDNHNFIYFDRNGNLLSEKFYKIKEKHIKSKTGFWGKIPVTFIYSGKGICLTDQQIRLMVAVIADGHFCRKTNHCRIKVKKARKIERIKILLNEAHIQYKESVELTGYHNFWFNAPLRQREYTSMWYNCTQHQFQVIINEVFNWDGCKTNQKYSTSSKASADFIQFAFSACGFKSQIYEQNRIGEIHNINGKTYYRKTNLLQVDLCKTKTISLRSKTINNKPIIENYKTNDGFKYCFTVPSHMLVLRRNNKIFITGNCGKTSISKAILKIYSNSGYRIAATAFSAKAAQRITEATGFPASTIHRLLGAQGITGFTYNHDNPLPYDVVFLDEASMVNLSIFHALVSAIREGSKLIICGDDKQLPPIGYGNVFSDLIQKSDIFNTNQLMHVHRQAEKSGILSDANKIREGICPIDRPELKIISGELKDMVYMFRDERNALQDIAIRTYLKSIEQDGLDDTVIITPRKQDCINSTLEINKIIQESLIPNDVESLKYGNKTFKLGAKVIQRENNYEKNVFNGEIGYITKIWEEQRGKDKISKFEIEFKMNDCTKTIQYARNELDQIDLAYALTVHLSQGSGYKTVIVIIDNTDYKLLDTCLLYTALTRAKKRCLLVAEPSAFKKCIDSNKSINRQTWLKDMN